MKMHDIQQSCPKLRSRPLVESRSVYPLGRDGVGTGGDMVAPYPPPTRSCQRASPTPIHHYRKPPMSNNSNDSQGKSCVGSMWQQLMVGASSAAGTTAATAAVVRADSIKCIKYCLSWVQYAMRHIEQQMDIVRTFLVSLAASQHNGSSSFSSSPACVLSTVKKEVVDTLRKVVDIISRYAGASLPYHAKVTVRGFILNLPSRWASLNDSRSSTTSAANSPMLSTTKDRSNQENEEMALRLLNFGQESVDMLRSVSGVFSGTVQRADAWLYRLRLRQPPPPSTENNISSDDPSIQLAPIHNFPYGSNKVLVNGDDDTVNSQQPQKQPMNFSD